jgi:hypothetical protein
MTRVIETVVGREAAQKAVAGYVETFNSFNVDNCMVLNASGLEAYDDAGSGEFCRANCLNLNQAESCEAEVYEIEVLP